MIDHFDEDEHYEPECSLCHDTGKVVADDGYHEYLGYSEVPCSCCAGMQWIGLLGPVKSPFGVEP